MQTPEILETLVAVRASKSPLLEIFHWAAAVVARQREQEGHVYPDRFDFTSLMSLERGAHQQMSSHEFLADREMVLNLVSEDGMALQYAAKAHHVLGVSFLLFLGRSQCQLANGF